MYLYQRLVPQYSSCTNQWVNDWSISGCRIVQNADETFSVTIFQKISAMGQWLSTECWWDISQQHSQKPSSKDLCIAIRGQWLIRGCWLSEHFHLQPLLKLPKDSINDFWMNGKECWHDESGWTGLGHFLLNSKIIRIKTKNDDDHHHGDHITTGNCRALTGLPASVS